MTLKVIIKPVLTMKEKTKKMFSQVYGLILNGKILAKVHPI